MTNWLRWSVVLACGIGIYVSWIPSDGVWFGFATLFLLLFLLWTGSQLLHSTNFRLPAVLLPIAGILLWGELQLAFGWSIYPFATEVELLRFGVNAAILILSYRLFEGTNLQEKFISFWLWYSLLLTFVSLVQLFSGTLQIFGLFLTVSDPKLGPFLNRDHYATFMILMVPMALHKGVGAGIRILPLGAAAAMYASVIASQSRAGAVILTLEIFVFFLLLRLKRQAQGREMGLAAGVLLAVVATLVIVVGWEPLINRFSRESDLYHNERWAFLSTSGKMLWAHPVTGFGLGTWALAYPGFATYDNGKFVNAAHSDWAQWAVEGGFPLLGLMICCLGFTLVLAVRGPWTLGLAGVLVHCLVEFPLQRPFLGAVFFCCLGVANGVSSPLDRLVRSPLRHLVMFPWNGNQKIE